MGRNFTPSLKSRSTFAADAPLMCRLPLPKASEPVSWLVNSLSLSLTTLNPFSTASGYSVFANKLWHLLKIFGCSTDRSYACCALGIPVMFMGSIVSHLHGYFLDLTVQGVGYTEAMTGR